MDELYWVTFEAQPAERRALCLAVHGLNTNGAMVFRDLAEVLAEQGVEVRGLQLSGHHVDPQTRRAPAGSLSANADFGSWVDEVRRGADALRQEAPDVPLLGLGYSIGGAATMMAQAADRVYDGLFLLAPAVRLGGLAQTFVWLNMAVTSPFGAQGWAWRPSGVRPEYRAHDYIAAADLFTGVQAQRALATLAGAELQALDGVATVVMRPGDPAVSARGARRFFEARGLAVDWVEVPNATSPGVSNHEVFNAAFLEGSWERVTERLAARVEQTIAAGLDRRATTSP